MQNVWFVAAAWMGLAFVASVISIRIGVSVALLEIAAGVIAGNFLGFQPTEWINFLATFGAGLLTFLAGAEIDPESLRCPLAGKCNNRCGLVSRSLPRRLGICLLGKRLGLSWLLSSPGLRYRLLRSRSSMR